MKGPFSAAGPEGLAGHGLAALLASSEQPQHPPWPHRHVSREAGLIKLLLVLAVLLVLGVMAAVNGWRAWRRRVVEVRARSAGPKCARNGRRRRVQR